MSRPPTAAVPRPPVLGLLVRRELAELLGKRRTRGVMVLIVLVPLLAAVIAGARYRADRRAFDVAVERYERHLEAASVNDLADLYHPAIKPPFRLALIAGAGELTSPKVDRRVLSAWLEPELVGLRPIRPYRKTEDERLPETPLGLDQRLPEPEPLDWQFLIGVVLSLAAFVLGYDALCGRRQRALLRLTLSYAVDRRQALLAKLAALWTCLALPFVAGAGASVLVMVGYGGLRPSGEEMAKMAAALAVGLWAIAFFVLIALLVSALVGAAARALATLALVWVAAVVAIPAAAVLLAQVLRPTPTELQIAHRMADVRRQVEGERGAGSWRAPALAKEDDFRVERRAAAIQNRRWRLQEAVRREVISDQLAQVALFRDLACLSPTFLAQDLIQRLVGAGLVRDRAFVAQARAFDRALKQRLRQLDASDPSSPHLCFFAGYLSRRPIDPGRLVRFELREPSLADGLAAGAGRGLIFALETALMAFLVGFCFERDHLR